ncbi:MAG: WYL domain-containing protein [Erysipelotrichaceae bacterium]|nr:WYL domain-containing protein [Erysipelotrichaceae bacterium]
MNNRTRILSLLQLLRSRSDEEHPLSTETITELLENEYGLEDVYRKTINQDLRELSEIFPDYQFSYRHKAGYSLSEAPFSLTEIKILLDSLDSLQTLDERFLKKLAAKLYSFLSVYEAETLEGLRSASEHGSSHFIYHFETLLNAYKHSHSVILKRRGKDGEEEILPIYFDRVRNQYYLFYRYPQKKKIYRLRFDNIESLSETENEADLSVSGKEIRRYIEEASDAYHGDQTMTLTLQLVSDNPKLKRWLKEDFPQIRFYDDIAVLSAGISNRLFARLLAYGSDIRIKEPQEAADAFIDYLKETIRSYEG